MSSDDAALEVLRRLERVPLMIAMRLGDLAPPDGSQSPLETWVAAYKALDALGRDVSGLISEARQIVRPNGEVRQGVAVNTGSNSAGRS